MRRFIISLGLLVLTVLSIQAQDKKDSPTDAVFQKIIKEYTLNMDGSIDYRCIKQVKLLTFYSIHRLYGETFIVYNPDYQTLKINECYTIMTDGKKVIAPENAFNEVLPRNAANAPVFNNLKEMVVTHTGLEKGAVVYLDYTIKSKKGFYPALMGQEELAEACPVSAYDIKVKVPDGTPLNFRLYHAKGEPTITLEGNKRTYSWHFEDLKALIPETCQPDNFKFVPTMVFTTAKGMNQLLAGLHSQPAFQDNFSNDMRIWADAVQKEKKDELSTVLAIQEKVINEFNLYSVPLNNIGFKVRTSEEVWKSAGGTEIEKAVMFIDLLTSIRIQAEVVLSFQGYYDIGIGNILNINHVYVSVRLKNETSVLLSMVDLNDQNLYQKKSGILVPLVYKMTPDPIPARSFNNLVKLSGKMELQDDNNLEGKLNIHKEGMANPYLLLTRNPSKITAGISGFGSSDITDHKVVTLSEELSECTIKTSKKSACKKEGDYYFYTWPVSDAGISSWHVGELVDDRSNPFEIPFPLTESYSYEMEIPSHWTLVNPLQHLELKNAAGQLIAECKQEKSKILWTCELRLFESPINQVGLDYYKNIKELISRWNTIQAQGSIVKAEK